MSGLDAGRATHGSPSVGFSYSPSAKLGGQGSAPLPAVSTRFGAPGRDPAENGRKGGIRSGEVRREQGKSVRDRLREQVEEHFELIWSAFESGLLSDDERAKIAAAVSVLAEAYGRPAQRTELTGADGGPVELAAVRERLVARLDRLRERPTTIETGEPTP